MFFRHEVAPDPRAGEAVADQMAHAVFSGNTLPVMRHASKADAVRLPATGVLSSPGHPLDADTRQYMEPRFGQDFSRVRVHHDSDAHQSAAALRADAFTVGEQIVFSAGQFAPRSQAGRLLLAHELAHVVQQRRAGVVLTQRQAVSEGPAPTGADLRAPKAGIGERLSLSSGVPAAQVSAIDAATVATVYFGRDRWLMEPDGFAAVQKLAEQLTIMAKPFVTVDGHASGEGPERHNEDLARLRREGVIAVFSSRVPGATFAGGGHGATAPAVPESAADTSELETQRARNRRVTIVMADLASPGPSAPAKAGPDIFKLPPIEPETPQEESSRRLKEMLKLPPELQGRPKRSFSEQLWAAVDDQLNTAMAKIGVPRQFRGPIKDGAHALIEKGAETVLDSALDAAHLSSQQKEAVKAAVRAAAQTKL